MLDQKINIASFNHHMADALLACYSSSEHGYKRLKCEVTIHTEEAPEVCFTVERSGEDTVRFYNFDIAVEHYNSIEIEAPKMATADDGTPLRQIKRGNTIVDGKAYEVLHADHMSGNDVIRKGDYIYISNEDRIKEVSDRLVMEDISHGAHIFRPLCTR